jgi:hypothetical protein
LRKILTQYFTRLMKSVALDATLAKQHRESRRAGPGASSYKASLAARNGVSGAQEQDGAR